MDSPSEETPETEVEPDAPESRSTLCLWGFMGTGKSTVGKLLAREVSAALIDLDAVIEAHAQMSIAALFATEGEAAFRRLEQQTLREMLKPADGARVIALGGGALVHDATRELALRNAFVVTLTATVADIVQRTSRGTHRPLLKGAAPKGTALKGTALKGTALKGTAPEAKIKQLLDARRDVYQTAHAMVNTSSRSAQSVVKYLAKYWQPSDIRRA